MHHDVTASPSSEQRSDVSDVEWATRQLTRFSRLACERSLELVALRARIAELARALDGLPLEVVRAQLAQLATEPAVDELARLDELAVSVFAGRVPELAPEHAPTIVDPLAWVEQSDPSRSLGGSRKGRRSTSSTTSSKRGSSK